MGSGAILFGTGIVRRRWKCGRGDGVGTERRMGGGRVG
jgi:hypothetical protein